MSRSLNKVTLIGNLGADPEVRSTSNGVPGRHALARHQPPVEEPGRREAGKDRVASRRPLEQQGLHARRHRRAYCKKGDKVYVEGSIEYRSWQDREGQTRYTTEITARELILLSGAGEGAESFTPGQQGRRRPARPRPRARTSRSRISRRRSTPRTTTCRSDRLTGPPLGRAGAWLGAGRPQGHLRLASRSRAARERPEFGRLARPRRCITTA